MAKKIDLTKITLKFGRAYTSAKRASERQAKAQAEFFAAIDQTLEGAVRKQKVIDYPGEDLAPQEYVERYYPGWRVVRQNPSGNELVIEEDPRFMKYTFPNPQDGMVYGRTYAQLGNGLDIERLQEENPELWEQITTWPEPWFSMLREYAERWNIDEEIGSMKDLEEHIGKYLEEMGMLRTLKDPELWTDPELKALEKYLVPGKLSIRLVPPRKATDEELGN